MSEETDKNKRILLATKLANGTATQQERDAALAELLLTLWDTPTLNKQIDERIDEKSANLDDRIDERIEKKCKACVKISWQSVIVELIHCLPFWIFATVALIIGGTSLIQTIVGTIVNLF